MLYSPYLKVSRYEACDYQVRASNNIFVARYRASLTVTLISFLAVSLGDEDGSFDCLISQVDGPFKAALTILVSGRYLSRIYAVAAR